MRVFSIVLGAALLSGAEAITMNYPGSTTTIQKAADWQTAGLSDLKLLGNALTLAPGKVSGTLTSAPLTLPAFDEVVPSWNAHTGKAGSVGLEVRAQVGGKWSPWYSFGQWSAAEGRASRNGQKDALGQILTDTLRLSSKATAAQYRLTLNGVGTTASLVALNTSDRSQRTARLGQASSRAAWGKVINVPQRSQMLYPDGGEVWCSPTSVSMILAHYGVNVTVPQAAHGMYDRVYDGTGNWPFNTAYAAEQGMQAYVTRLPSLAAAEKFIAAGQPLAVSLGWKKGELPGAPISYSDGHLMVLVGFDAQGNPVMNDPAGPNNESVRRTYPRAAFEKLWLTHSGGVAYVITPAGTY